MREAGAGVAPPPLDPAVEGGLPIPPVVAPRAVRGLHTNTIRSFHESMHSASYFPKVPAVYTCGTDDIVCAVSLSVRVGSVYSQPELNSCAMSVTELRGDWCHLLWRGFTSGPHFGSTQ